MMCGQGFLCWWRSCPFLRAFDGMQVTAIWAQCPDTTGLGLAVANALTAAECGADYIDVTCRGLGAGAGNAQAEVVAGVFQRLGYSTGLDFYSYMDLAENVVEPIMQRPQIIKSAPLMLGYAGVYSSFLLHTYRAAEKFHLNPRDILVELGRRGMVGGQEDMIIDVAHALSLAKTEC